MADDGSVWWAAGWFGSGWWHTGWWAGSDVAPEPEVSNPKIYRTQTSIVRSIGLSTGVKRALSVTTGIERSINVEVSR